MPFVKPALTPSCTSTRRRRADSVALGHSVDLVGDQPVGLAVHGGGGLRVRRVDQAEDLALLLLDPLPQAVDVVLRLHA
jgi:hypothetical protein